MHRRLSAKCIPLMRILTCTRVQSRFGEGLENRPEEGCAEGGRGCFVVGRTSEGKTWWPLVAAFIRGGTLRTFWDLSSLLSALFSVPPPPFSFSLFHHDRSRVYTTIVVPKGGGGFVRRKKKKKLFHWELFAIKKKKKGTRLCRLLFQPNIPRCRRKKNLPPVFTPTFGYLETHYRAPSREHGLRTFLKSSTISRIRARWMYCVA